ncbi:MAG TPA: aminodeoxychorismate synthase component I [Pyrinomonadaceae bacterium]|nr:aminodeoxychorismate synthase component I [Pyrinomonadaceae bacterium]
MHEIDTSADELVDKLLTLGDEGSCILDSCGVGHLNSHLLIAGLAPNQTITADKPNIALQELDRVLSGDQAAIFTLSYKLGSYIQGVHTSQSSDEPLAFIATFDSLVIHDYDSGKTSIAGNQTAANRLIAVNPSVSSSQHVPAGSARTCVSRADYLRTINEIKEEIRNGNTYQTNLTRRIEAHLPANTSDSAIFRRLRAHHPAPFSAYIKRPGSTVISASPERFFKIENGSISASPIKGTRPRGTTREDDSRLRSELLNSEKDRAENTMIVDLLRNDLGRVCEFGSVAVETLCEIEEHPSLFHLVSTINGVLKKDLKFSEILTALFPCGSITGAPKLSTMKIVDRLESTPRGLSMGAIGYYLPASFGLGETIDLSVAIRTMVIRDNIASFNVGGGIVIDSDPEKEWDETATKSRSLLDALGIDPEAIKE